MIVLPALIALIITYVLWYVIKLTLWAIRAANMISNIPGPKAWPIIGNCLLFIKLKTQEDMLNYLKYTMQTYQNPGKIFRYWVGPRLVIILGHHKHIETVLSSEKALDKSFEYKYMQIAARGVVSLNGLEWRELRKPINKLMTKKMVESNVEMFHKKAVTLCKVLEKHAGSSKQINMEHYLTNCSLDAISMSGFGYDLNELEREDYHIAEKLERALELMCRMLRVFPHCVSLTYAKMSWDGKQLINVARQGFTLCHEMLDGRTKNRTLSGGLGEKAMTSDIFIEKIKREELSWEEAGRLVLDFIMAATHTSSTIAAHTFLLLAMYPEHQEGVYREQVDLLGEDPEVGPTWDQLSQMPYLTRVLKETLRHFCPIAFFRNISEDLDLGEYKLPKGSNAMIALYFLHRDPQNWSHPKQFYPDHFLPEEVAKRPKGAYFPFGLGPRSCPGNIYAMALLKIIISTAVRKYRFETDLKFEQLTYKMSVMLEAAQGCRVKIIPRDICDK